MTGFRTATSRPADFILNGCRLTGGRRGGGAITLGRPGSGLGGFDVTIARRCVGDEASQQLVRGCRHLLHGALERGLVGLRWPRKAAQLAHELQRRGADLRVRRGWLEIVQSLDAATHVRSSCTVLVQSPSDPEPAPGSRLQARKRAGGSHATAVLIKRGAGAPSACAGAAG